MDRKLKTFAMGDEFLHHYDFGTTTESVITIIGDTTRKPQRSIVRLLARNSPPVIKCTNCGKPAVYIRRAYDGPNENLFYCFDCGEEYVDTDYHLLPVTNSPRMGECGYEGEYDDFTFSPTIVVREQAGVVQRLSSKGKGKMG